MTAKKKPTRGGAREGAGRKAIDGATNLVRVQKMIRFDQVDKLKRLGGSAWLRAQIDRSK